MSELANRLVRKGVVTPLKKGEILSVILLFSLFTADDGGSRGSIFITIISSIGARLYSLTIRCALDLRLCFVGSSMFRARVSSVSLSGSGVEGG